MSHSVLLSDISNGSGLKFALAHPGERPQGSTHYACQSLADFESAVSDFLATQDAPRLKGAAISVAGWESNGVVESIHYGFKLKRADLRDLLGVQRLNIVNNFVAKALAIPCLKDHEREKICGGEAIPDQVISVIGPGQGLGVAALTPDGMGNWTAMPSEGGHSDLPAATELEAQVLSLMREKYGHVSRERALSLPGISEIWRCLSVLDKDEVKPAAAEEIIALAYADHERARRCVAMCMDWYAATASDCALVLGARGGVYLTGDLLDLIGDLFDAKAFAARFYAKGRVSGYMKDIPVFRARARELEIIGLTTLFDPDLMPA